MRVVEDADPCETASQSLPVRANTLKFVFPATCAVEKLPRASVTLAPRADVRTGLLHAAAARKRDGSVSAPPFFLSKSKRLL